MRNWNFYDIYYQRDFLFVLALVWQREKSGEHLENHPTPRLRKDNGMIAILVISILVLAGVAAYLITKQNGPSDKGKMGDSGQ